MATPNPVSVASSTTSPLRSPQSGTSPPDTVSPSGLGAYGVSRPRFLSNQVNSPPSVKMTAGGGPSKQSFRYRPSRPSLGYIFDRNHAPPRAIGSPTSPDKKGKNKKGSKSKSKKNKNKNKNEVTQVTRQQMQQIQQARKQSTLASFSQTPHGQALDAIKRELDFLKKEVPSFNAKYENALNSFSATSHSKSRQVEFAFIQALSQWIIEDGAPAVKQLDEFKEDVQHEITGLVSTCEDLSKQNQSLQIVLSDLQQRNEQISRDYHDAQQSLQKVSTELKDTQAQEETQQLEQNDIVDLSKDLEQSEEQRLVLKEKVKRLENYLKQSQKDNDELSNKQYKMENDLQQSKAEIAKMHAKIGALEQRHEQELMLLAQAHENYKSQMETEQAQLIQIAQESQQQVQQMAANMGKPRSGSVVTPMPVFDDEYNTNTMMKEDGATTLDAEFSQYPYSEDEWLDDSDDGQEEQTPVTQLEAVVLDANTINIEPVKEPTPPPFDAEFAMIKESGGISPRDPTKTFKMEKEKRTLELEDPTKNFSNERQSYFEDTVDVTEAFSMEKQSTNNEEKEKDVTMEFETVKKTVQVEQKDPATMWRMEKQSVEVDKIDPEASFVSEKQEFGVDAIDPTKHFAQESQSFDLERADISNTFVTEKQKEIRQESKEMEMVYEKQSIQHDRDSLELEFSQTALSRTPKVSDADNKNAGYESTRITIEQAKEEPKKQYAYQVRHLRMENDAAPTRITKIRKPPPAPHDRPNWNKHYDGKDEIIRKSLAFQKIMSKWKKDEQEKGGKPQILVQREFELINKWNMDEKKKTSTMVKPSVTKKPVNRVDSSLTVSPASPSSEIFSSLSQNSQQRVTKARHHKLKPKLRGKIKIIHSYFVPKYQLKREMAFYFCLDGLPSTTNLDKNESEKGRKNDFLVPVLFFFEKEEDFKQLAKEVGALPVRNAMFQKAFARLAKGIITLHTHAIDSSLEVAINKLQIMKGRPILDVDTTKDTKEFTGNSLYVVSESDFHRFEFENSETRDEWLHKINKLVMKRTKSVAMASETYTRSHKESLGFGTPIQRASRASSRMTGIKAVETGFD